MQPIVIVWEINQNLIYVRLANHWSDYSSQIKYEIYIVAHNNEKHNSKTDHTNWPYRLDRFLELCISISLCVQRNSCSYFIEWPVRVVCIACKYANVDGIKIAHVFQLKINRIWCVGFYACKTVKHMPISSRPKDFLNATKAM